jgi:hypothetical protein
MAARNVGEWSEIYAVARLLTNEVSYDLAGGGKQIIRARVQHSIAEPAVEYAITDQIVSVKQGSSEPVELERRVISDLANDLLTEIQVKNADMNKLY